MNDFLLEEEDIQFQKLKLHTYSYQAHHPKGIVFICHGFGEHTLNHKKYINLFSADGFSVFAVDLPDHGKSATKSDDPQGYIDSFPDTVDYWVAYIQSISSKPQFENLPKFFLGHSLGGTLGILISRKVKNLLYGVVLSAPTIYINKSSTEIFFLRVLANVWGTAPAQWMKLTTLSHDPKVIEDRLQDKLYVKRSLPVHTAREIYNGTVEIAQHYDQDDYPVLLVHGQLDAITPIKNSEIFYERAASKDKTFKPFPEMFHEIHNESCGHELRQLILTWVNNHMTKPVLSSSSAFSSSETPSSSASLSSEAPSSSSSNPTPQTGGAQ